MALINIPTEQVTLRERAEVTAFLATHGIDYETWTPERPVGPDASSDEPGREWKMLREK